MYLYDIGNEAAGDHNDTEEKKDLHKCLSCAEIKTLLITDLLHDHHVHCL